MNYSTLQVGVLMTQLQIWLEGNDPADVALKSTVVALKSTVVEGVAYLTAQGLVEASSNDPPAVAIVAATDNACEAVALVPDALAGAVQLNGRLVEPGMHLLQHGEWMAVHEQRIWVSAARCAEETAYDPAVHGEEVYCFRTRARLQPGDEIAVCPGTAQHPCGMLYKLSAWQVGLACPHCGFDPTQPAWQPPATNSNVKAKLDELLQLVNHRRDRSA